MKRWVCCVPLVLLGLVALYSLGSRLTVPSVEAELGSHLSGWTCKHVDTEPVFASYGVKMGYVATFEIRDGTGQPSARPFAFRLGPTKGNREHGRGFVRGRDFAVFLPPDVPSHVQMVIFESPTDTIK